MGTDLTTTRPSTQRNRTSIPQPVHRVRRTSSLRATWQLARLLARPTLAQRSAWTLPVTALGIVSALVLTVVAGATWFFRLSNDLAGVYKIFAATAVTLLVVPLGTLAGAAARLSASRRDDRLASLRLIGASTATVRLLTLLETGACAVVGVLVGLLGYAVLTPAVGMLHFAGRPIGAAGLWPGLPTVLLTCLAIVLLSLASAAVGLRRVEISPLGVRTRQDAARVHWARLAFGIVAIGVAGSVAQSVRSTSDMGMAVVACLVALGVPLLAVNLIGPWLVRLLAGIDQRRATTATQLIAARTVLENPKHVWRQVGGLAMVSFVAVVLGVATSYADRSSDDPTNAMMLHDMRLGVQLTLAIAFVTVACSVTITQMAAVLDRRALYVNLDMAGTPFPVLDAARRRAVLRPLMGVVLVSVAAALVVVVPVAGHNHLTDPLSSLTTAAMLVGGVALVVLALLLTRTTLRGVLRDGLARVE